MNTRGELVVPGAVFGDHCPTPEGFLALFFLLGRIRDKGVFMNTAQRVDAERTKGRGH